MSLTEHGPKPQQYRLSLPSIPSSSDDVLLQTEFAFPRGILFHLAASLNSLGNNWMLLDLLNIFLIDSQNYKLPRFKGILPPLVAKFSNQRTNYISVSLSSSYTFAKRYIVPR